MFEDAALSTREIPINTATALVKRHAELNAELEALIVNEAATPKRLTSRGMSPEIVAKSAEVEAVEQQMADSWVTFVLQQQTGSKWRAFKAKHPPRGGKDDTYLGVDTDAVITTFLPVCTTSPAMTDEDWDRALQQNGIWPADQLMLAYAIVHLHEVGFSVPKSRLVSEIRRTADEASEQLANSVSPSAGSRAGSRKRSTSTTTQPAS